MDLWMMETIYPEPQQSTPVVMDSGWWDPARDSVRSMATGLGRHLSANVRLQLLYGMCYEHILQRLNALY